MLRINGFLKIIAATLLAAAAPAAHAENQRLFVLTDIGNEPDDQMSLVRLLLYSNEIDIEGIAATTSTWQRDKVSPEIIEGVVSAFCEVLPRLREHAQCWPTCDALKARILRGVAGYGMAAINPAKPSPAALALIKAARSPDARPLWVNGWGGTNTLAEALNHARITLSKDELAKVVAKLRVYAISDQDDAGLWLRREFPNLFYIVSPSSQDSYDYRYATWTGISGDRFYLNGEGADFTTVTNEWLDTHIRSKGPLGARYPRYLFIMEGDTPSFLGLIPNGLQSHDRPDWGGWGGRYVLRTPNGETRPIWTQGFARRPHITSTDTVNGVTSDQATIWRWRTAFQHDFAARMDWTVKPFAMANHPPRVVVNGLVGSKPIELSAKVGESIALDASSSSDPDRDRLTYRWFQYHEAGLHGSTGVAPLTIASPASPRPKVRATATCGPGWFGKVPCKPTGSAHLILAVTDSGRPALTRYRRVIVMVSQGATTADGKP